MIIAALGCNCNRLPRAQLCSLGCGGRPRESATRPRPSICRRYGSGKHTPAHLILSALCILVWVCYCLHQTHTAVLEHVHYGHLCTHKRTCHCRCAPFTRHVSPTLSRADFRASRVVREFFRSAVSIYHEPRYVDRPTCDVHLAQQGAVRCEC